MSSYTFTRKDIDTAVAEFGAPMYRLTDDNESGYWQFRDIGDEFVADSPSELFQMAKDYFAQFEKEEEEEK